MYVPAGVVHEVEVVLHLEEDDERRHDLPDGEAGQRVLVAHDQQLTHLDHRLQLSRFVSCCLQALQQLVSLRRRRRGHRTVQDLLRGCQSYLIKTLTSIQGIPCGSPQLLVDVAIANSTSSQ